LYNYVNPQTPALQMPWERTHFALIFSHIVRVLMIYVVRKVAIKTKSRHRVVNIRSMKNFNVDRFKNELTSLPWSLVDNLENANDRWEL
jgi:hypothetical protein